MGADKLRDHRDGTRCPFVGKVGLRLVGVLAAPVLLSACPPSDDYFTKVGEVDAVDTDLGATTDSSTSGVPTGVITTGGGIDAGATRGTGGEPDAGATAGASGGDGGTGGEPDAGGTGGTPGTGGSSAGDGGSGGTVSSGGNGGSGGSGGSDVSGSGGVGGADCMPVDESCDGLDNDCDQGVDEDDACDEDCAGFVLDGVSYMYCGAATLGSQLEALCATQGMAPVHVDSAEENAALVNAVAPLDAELGEPNGQQRAFHLGASDSDAEGTWLWLDDDTVFWNGDETGAAVDDIYNNWGVGRPNNANFAGEDCAVVYLESGEEGDPGEWNDVQCIDGYSVVCELP